MVFQIDFVLRYLDTGIGNHSGGIRQKVQDMAQNLYIDTRGCADRPVAFTEAVVDGLAQGGGLYVPERIPSLSLEDILALADLPYAQRAARIYRAFDIDLPDEVVDALMAQAYGKNFDDERICPLTSLDAQTHVLELWHGPTSAFKDMALQCLPRFFSASAGALRERGQLDHDFLILVATSGDTGKAALEGLSLIHIYRDCVDILSSLPAPVHTPRFKTKCERLAQRAGISERELEVMVLTAKGRSATRIAENPVSYTHLHPPAGNPQRKGRRDAGRPLKNAARSRRSRRRRERHGVRGCRAPTCSRQMVDSRFP